MMAFSIIIMVALEPEVQTLIIEAIYGEAGFHWGLMFVGMVMLLERALYHVFSRASKTREEKRSLVGFAAFFCIISGMLGGFRLYQDQNSLLQIFGIWNILQGLAVALLFKIEALNETSMPDKETPLAGAFANFVITASLYIVLKFGFKLHYIDIFSICVAFAMSFSSWVCSYIHGHDSIEESSGS